MTLWAGPPAASSASPAVHLELARQEADSLLWRVGWTAPELGPGVSAPTGYEIQVDVDDDPEGFEGPTAVEVVDTLGPDARTYQLRTGLQCETGLWVHVRVRALGSWVASETDPTAVTETAWGTGSAEHTCADVVPGPPAVQVDTATADTAAAVLPTHLISGAWFPGEERWDPSPWTMTVGDTAILCWYAASEGGARLHGRWPASCPDSGVVSVGPLAVLPDSSMRVRCSGDEQLVSAADGFDLVCGDASQAVIRWTYDPASQLEPAPLIPVQLVPEG